MDLSEVVRATAHSQGLLADGTEALQVSSITVVEFVVTLEEAVGTEIPNAEMTAENFQSIASVVQMLTRLRARAQT